MTMTDRTELASLPARIGQGARGPGRPKGSPNRVTADVREMVIAALQRAGGVRYLARQAELNPVAFLALVGKTLPLKFAGASGDAPIREFRVVFGEGVEEQIAALTPSGEGDSEPSGTVVPIHR